MHWRPDKDRELLLPWSLELKQKKIESHANKTPANHRGSKHIAHVFTQTRTAGPPRRADPAVPPTAQSWRVSRTNWASLHREQRRPEVMPLSRRRGGGALPVVSRCQSFQERRHPPKTFRQPHSSFHGIRGFQALHRGQEESNPPTIVQLDPPSRMSSCWPSST